MGLWYSKDFEFELIAYSDADHAGCHEDCKSTSGGIQFLGDKLVSWSSKKQDCTAMLRTSHLDEDATTIGRCNNYTVLPNIPCPRECSIVWQLLVDHALSYALTATADVPVVYLQQFWKTAKQVLNANETIRFNIDSKEITYTVDMFRANLKIPVETPEQPFILPATLEYIQPFLKIVGYQGFVDKVDAFYTKNLAQPSQTIYTGYKDYEEEFNRLGVPMIHPEPVKSTQGSNRTSRSTKTTNLVDVEGVEKFFEGREEETDGTKFSDLGFLSYDDFGNRVEPESHKKNPKKIDVDDDEKKYDRKDDDDDDIDDYDHTNHALIRNPRTGALKRICQCQGIMMQQMEKKYVTNRHFQDNKEKVDEVLHYIVPKIASNATNDLILDNLPRIVANAVKKERESSRAGNMVLNVHPTTSASTVTTISDLQQQLYLNMVLNVHPTTSASTVSTTSDLQQKLYLKMKLDLQAQVDDLELWDVLRAKFEKTLALAGSCRDDAFRKRNHDDHQGDDAPPKTSKSSKSARGSLSKQPVKDTNTSASGQQQHQQDWDAWVDDLVIDGDEETLRDTLSNPFRDAEEYAYHLEQSQNYMENQIRNPNEPSRYLYNKDLSIHVVSFPEVDLEEKMNHWAHKVRDDPEEVFSDYGIVEVVQVTTDQQFGFDFMERTLVMRGNDKPDCFSEADFKYMNKNDMKICRVHLVG
ncbi:hypothetical protein Tco_0969931 [Tanacetum coccineum]